MNKKLMSRLMVIVLTMAIFTSSQVTGALALDASWYSRASLIKEGTWKNGKEQKMANGKRFEDSALTCASRLHALGDRIRVTNLENKKSVIVTVTDRIGKRFAKSRIDLSRGAFEKIANLKEGVVPVKVELIK